MTALLWSDPAKEDLAAIDAYWWLNNPARADDILDRIRNAGLFLAELPGAGSPAALDTRKWRVRGTDYILVYRAALTAIQILRVYHGRQDRTVA